MRIFRRRPEEPSITEAQVKQTVGIFSKFMLRKQREGADPNRAYQEAAKEIPYLNQALRKHDQAVGPQARKR